MEIETPPREEIEERLVENIVEHDGEAHVGGQLPYRFKGGSFPEGLTEKDPLRGKIGRLENLPGILLLLLGMDDNSRDLPARLLQPLHHLPAQPVVSQKQDPHLCPFLLSPNHHSRLPRPCSFTHAWSCLIPLSILIFGRHPMRSRAFR